MATYNGEQHIKEQLDSIARQDLLPIELVVTDDGSTDSTLQIVDAFASAAPFTVRIFRNENKLGYADNFLKAASLCQGDLIAFCDQDDIWLENKLSVCEAFFGNSAVMLAVHAAQTISNSKKSRACYPHFSNTEILNLDTCNPFANRPGFAMVIRRELLCLVDHRQRPAAIYSHDHWLWFLAASSGQVATIADNLMLYRQHRGNVFGAPQPLSVIQQASRVAATIDYDQSADFELRCAHILSVVARQYPEREDRLNLSRKKLEFRSKLHRIRTRIYKEPLPWRRASAFMEIVLLGGYCPDKSGTRLGLRAAMKDFLFGVPGVYRFFASEPRPSKQT